MSIDDVMKELKEIKENPELITQGDSPEFSILKNIIKIERRYLYGQDSTSAGKRKNAVRDLLTDHLKNRAG